MTVSFPRLPLTLSLLILSFISTAFGQGQTACKAGATDLDWYTNAVGETPCRTYERLRQICDSSYRVGSQNPNTPPDFCDSQVAGCCCNSVAFALSMLCLNCQQNLNAGNGIDAGAGAYQIYVDGSRNNNCSPVNKGLPADIQQATCRQGMKIYNGLYGLFWGTGDWFYTFTRQTLEKDFNAEGDAAFKCTTTKSMTIAPPTSISTSTATSTATVTEQPPTTTQPKEDTATNITTSKTTSSSSSSSSTRGSDVALVPSSTGTGPSTPRDGSASTPTSANDQNSNGTSESAIPTSSSSLGAGAIAGAALGGVVGLGAVLLLAFLCWKRSKSRQAVTSYPENHVMPYMDHPVQYDLVANYAMPSSTLSLTPNRKTMADAVGSGSSLNALGASGSGAGRSYNPYSDSDTDGGSSSGRPMASLATSSERGRGRPYSLSSSSPTSHSAYTGYTENDIDAGPIRPQFGIPHARLPPVYDERWREDRP